MKSKILFRHVAVALGLSVAITGGAAAALVTTWEYTQEFEFTDFAPAGVTASGETLVRDDVDGNTKLAWGTSTGEGQSSLVINAQADPNTDTPTGNLTSGDLATSTSFVGSLIALTFGEGPSITHNNNPITGTTLTSAVATDYVRLIPIAPPGGATQIQDDVDFNVLFAETPNNLEGLNCSWNNSPGNFCSDIFVIKDGFPGDATPVWDLDKDEASLAFLIDTFKRDGYRYDVYLNERTEVGVATKLGVLSDAACNRVQFQSGESVPNGCIGWVTAEGATTTAQLQFAIFASEIPVPAPGTLLLLSGGLIGLGAALRRKTRNASA